MKTSLQEKFLQYVAQTSPEPLSIEIERAEGCYFYDKNEKQYLDMIAGISVCNIGHSHPEIVTAVQKQAEKFMHVMVYGELVQQPQVELAELLVGILPENLNSVFFVNSGSEAVEGGLKLAKRVTQREEIIHFKNSYHGATNGAMSVMGNNDYRKAFQPLLPNTKAIEFGNFDDLKEITTQTAAIIVELVQGEAGVRTTSKEYWQALQQRCKETGALLIVDEIQSGLGRSGKRFAFEHYDITPDILLLAKALGGGLPVGAFIANQKMMNLFQANPVLGHITTFGGNAVCCAAALAHLKIILREKLWENVEKMTPQLVELFSQLDGVQEVRNLGFMIAVEFGSSQKNFQMIHDLLQKGIFTDWFLWCDTALRIAPPLTFNENHLQELKNRLQL